MLIGARLSILLCILLFVFPAEGAASFVWLLSIYDIFAGLIELIFAFCLWSLLRKFEPTVANGR